jgi:hypothetical protein
VFYFSWVIPALALLAVVSPLLVRLWLSLPPRTRTVMAAAGLLVVGGAVGMEMVEGGYVDVHGHKTLTYSLLANLEEALELVGQSLLVYGLLLIVRDEPGRPSPA